LNRVLIKYAAFIQFVAILLLQYYPVAAHLGQKQAQPQCSGNHALCGCAPEMIISGTCCCSRNKAVLLRQPATKPECCDIDDNHGEERVTRNDVYPASRVLSAAPCGGKTKFITASLEKLKFLCPEFPTLVRIEPSVCFTASLQETFPSRLGDPPDPPPILAHS